MTINYKIKTKLIEELLKNENFFKLQKSSFVGKFLKKKEYSDIYFHSGILDKEAIENIQNAKKIIVNSQSSKQRVLKEIKIDKENVEVIYPSIDINYDESVKLQILKELEIGENKKIILFRAKNFKTSGVFEFINFINYINYKNFIAIIVGDKKEISNLRFQISRLEVKDKIILLEDYENIDNLFIASDIFLLPTSNRSFSTDILKAMYCKCAVFTTIINDASELIDVFSTMENPSDRSTQFKLDALLQNEDELNLIKQQNYDVAKEFTLEKQLAKLKKIISELSLE